MTHTSPLPPSSPGAPAADVRTVMFGEPWVGPNGEALIAEHDSVVLTLFSDGRPYACLIQTPESAMGLATLIASAAGRATRNAVDDTGTRAPLAERLRRLAGQ